ncbi:hypothetical protein L4C39_19145 [Vibrio clamense]|uniref:hypothetical protein n=1 Tax=Vibrio clamense TaxID=2910254 RepID=UPI003D1CCF69
MIELQAYGSNERMLPQIQQVTSLLYREAFNTRQHENLKFLLNHGARDISHAYEMMNEFFTTGTLQLGRAVKVITLFNGTDHYAQLFGTTNFDVFSVYHLNLCSLLALKELFESGMEYKDIKAEPAKMKGAVFAKRKEFLPKPVKKWRNKVAAHYAAADPKSGDNVATLMQSLSVLPAYNSPYYTVAGTSFDFDGKSSQLEEWALTKVYDDLALKLPSMSKLPPLLESIAK